MRIRTLLPITALLLSGLGLADTTSTPVPVNAAVANSCAFNAAAPVITVPTYKATDVAPLSGQTTLNVLCNSGTQPFVTYWENEPNLTLALKASNNDVLNVLLGYGTDPVTPTPGATGGDVWSYILTATPNAGQFGASTGASYTNTANYIVAF